MAIWKELTNPESFAGEYETAVVAPAPVQRFAQSNGTTPQADKKESLIGPGVVIEGKIQGDGDIRIAGRLNGNILINGSLFVEPSAVITGAVSADNADLAGKVEGNISAVNHVRLLETGQLVGDLKAKILTVAPGARMRGKVEFGWDEKD